MEILVALDQTAQADTVLAKAVELAKKEGASLTIHCVAEAFQDFGDYFDAAALSEKLLEGVQAAAQGFKAKAQQMGLTPNVVVGSGVSPADLIIGQAEKSKADLIVMGSRGKKGLDKYLIGSVAATVAGNAPCSVLVLR